MEGIYPEGQPLPHSLEAEESVIGSLLIDADTMPLLARKLQPEAFYRERHALCFQAALDLYQKGETIDQVTLQRRLEVSGALDTVGGMSYLSHLISITPNSANAEYYAGIVKKCSDARKAIAILTQGVVDLYNGLDSLEVVGDLFPTLLPLSLNGDGDGPQTMRAIADDNFNRFSELLDAPPGYLWGVSTFTPALDHLLKGLRPGRICGIGSRPGVGKTDFALNMARHVATQGQMVFFFSLERSKSEIHDRLAFSMARVNASDYHAHAVDHPQRLEWKQQLEDARATLELLPIVVNEKPGISPVAVKATLESWIQTNGQPVLTLLDYGNLLGNESQSWTNRYSEFSSLMRQLQVAVRDWACPLLCFFQLNREIESRPNPVPQLSDFRDTGVIEEVCPVVMALHSWRMARTEAQWEQENPGERYPENLLDIYVLKNTFGARGHVQVFHEMASGFMGPVAA